MHRKEGREDCLGRKEGRRENSRKGGGGWWRWRKEAIAHLQTFYSPAKATRQLS